MIRLALLFLMALLISYLAGVALGNIKLLVTNSEPTSWGVYAGWLGAVLLELCAVWVLLTKQIYPRIKDRWG